MTPLMIAAKLGCSDVVVLLAGLIDVNVDEVDGRGEVARRI